MKNNYSTQIMQNLYLSSTNFRASLIFAFKGSPPIIVIIIKEGGN